MTQDTKEKIAAAFCEAAGISPLRFSELSAPNTPNRHAFAAWLRNEMAWSYATIGTHFGLSRQMAFMMVRQFTRRQNDGA